MVSGGPFKEVSFDPSGAALHRGFHGGRGPRRRGALASRRKAPAAPRGLVGPRPPYEIHVCLAATASPSPLATPSPPLSEGPAALRAAAPGRLGVRRAGGAERGASSHRPKKTFEPPGRLHAANKVEAWSINRKLFEWVFRLLWSRGLGCPWRVSFVHPPALPCTQSERGVCFHPSFRVSHVLCT